jgi:ubiquinone/menaquinone biosynthesis C-methylase UbiE
MTVERRNNTEVVQDILDLPGKRVLDVGCGPGVLVRMMTKAGAKVAGLECGALPLAKAQAADPVDDEIYVEGVGENIPFDDASFDMVIFFKSFHHVPADAQEKALSEATRVLVPGGTVYILEPLAEGSQFELGRLLEDETDVRAAAYKVIKDASKLGLIETREVAYVHVTKHTNFETYRDSKILVDAEREQMIRDNEETLRQTFEHLGRKTDAGMEFDQPMRVNLLRKGA